MNLDAIRGLSQPDQRSCGPSSLIAAHILVDPAYAATQNPHAFATSVLALHRELTAPSFGGRAQLPWPRALGTPPWAVARAMSSYTGLRYRTRLARFGGRAGLMSRMQAAVTAGHPVPLYVGDRWLPRHVVLAVEPADEGVLVYNPAHGTVGDMLASDFGAGKLTTFGKWAKPWFAVLPDGND
jgi:hypothetical protein